MPSRNGKLYKHEIKELIEMYRSEILRLRGLKRTAPTCNKNHYCAIGQRAASKIKAPDGRVKHHWSYDEKYLTDIIFLKPENHKLVHSTMKMNKDKKYFEGAFNNKLLLDTKIKHLRFVISVKKHRETNESTI
jgi:hypothetical protein